MPTPTRSAESRSERLIRLAHKAAEDLRLEIKPDEASGTPTTQVEFTFPAHNSDGSHRGTGRIFVGMPDEQAVQMCGTLTYADGGGPVRLCPEIEIVIMDGSLMDAQSDARVITTIKGVMRRMVAYTRPKDDKRDLQLLLRSGKKAGGDSPHDAPTQELAVV